MLWQIVLHSEMMYLLGKKYRGWSKPWPNVFYFFFFWQISAPVTLLTLIIDTFYLRLQSSPVNSVHMRCDLMLTALGVFRSRSSSWSGTPPGPSSPFSSPCSGSSPHLSSLSRLFGTMTRPSFEHPGEKWATCCWREFSSATPSRSWWLPHQMWACALSGGFS